MGQSSPAAKAFRAALIILLAVAGVLAMPRDAVAAGTVTIQNREPQENDGKWKLNMTINYGATPHLAHIPMLFIFEPIALYERSLLDASGEKPVNTRIALSNQQTINESMDVGFSDGSGKTFNITKFDFVIRRDRGFEAGEYKLTIKRAGDGVPVGQPQTLKLKGDNPIVDRRAMVFSGEKKKEKKAEPAGDKKEGSGTDAKEGEPSKDEPAAADPAASPGDPGAEAAAAGEAPPEVPPRQGGCGCHVVGASAEVPASTGGVPGFLVTWPAFALGLGAAARRIARRRAARG